ncbi:DinB family protein [Ferruginibacter yonginensis]|uniref:DinB family protein n=1 Tax=Ferruginibacter yonginensis TaxID=1310416 RepID=A0ABV8QNP4_9BACT
MANYFDKYTALVAETSVNTALQQQTTILAAFLNSIDETKSTYAYAPEKWTLKELLQHIIDTERIFTYRALCIARGETVDLPGYDENLYATASQANSRSWNDLVEEMYVVRKSTELLFRSLNDTMLQQKGWFNSLEGSAGLLGIICVGHVYHHINIAKERYGV